MATTTGRDPEYDAFGPWVDEVRTADEVPPLFRRALGAHLAVPADGALVLKVPRDIARRDAHAGMDLYDHLLAVTRDAFVVLSREPSGVRERVVPYGRIAAVRNAVSLLDADLTVRTQDGDVRVRYNGASREVVDRLVGELYARTHTVRGPSRTSPAGPSDDDLGLLVPGVLGPSDVGLVVAYRDVARPDPALRTLAAHGRQVLVPEAGRVVALAHLLSPMTLHALVVCRDAGTVQLFGRADPLVRGRGPVHSSARTVVPLAALDRVDVARHPVYPAVDVVTLVSGDVRTDVPVPRGGLTGDALRGLVSDLAPAPRR